MVVLLQLLSHQLWIRQTLTGGAGDFILRILFPNVSLQQGGCYNYLIESIIGKAHDHIAVFVLQMFLLQHLSLIHI